MTMRKKYSGTCDTLINNDLHKDFIFYPLSDVIGQAGSQGLDPVPRGPHQRPVGWAVYSPETKPVTSL